MLCQSVRGAEIKERLFPGIKHCRKVEEDLAHSIRAGKKVILPESSGRRERLGRRGNRVYHLFKESCGEGKEEQNTNDLRVI